MNRSGARGRIFEKVQSGVPVSGARFKSFEQVFENKQNFTITFGRGFYIQTPCL